MAEQVNIQIQSFKKVKVLFTGLVSILILALLLWEHFHGGVISHHILQQDDFPGISNWWGGLLLPALTWMLLGKMDKRLHKQALSTQEVKSQSIRALVNFILGLALGIIIAVSFVNDFTLFLENVPYLFVLLSLIIPIYYPEFILGFVFGMTYTFGAILPMAFILIMATLGFIIYRYIRPFIIKLAKVLKLKSSSKAEPLT